jgi:hypothetical protein
MERMVGYRLFFQENTRAPVVPTRLLTAKSKELKCIALDEEKCADWGGLTQPFLENFISNAEVEAELLNGMEAITKLLHEALRLSAVHGSKFERVRRSETEKIGRHRLSSIWSS